jgi:hypothetical protein
MLLLATSPASSNHSWGNYHWKRTTESFFLDLGDNVSGEWDTLLRGTSTDWSNPPATYQKKLTTRVVAGGTRPKNCRATSGRVEVCNAKYGFNGWLGIAQIWLSGGHITQGVAKLNDSYFSTPTYNTSDWRSFVMCQEVGHTFGLDHQDEDFGNAEIVPQTCMDYTNLPAGNGEPNNHDYEQLTYIYDHLESATASLGPGPGNNGIGSAAADGGQSPADWGKAVAFTKQGKPRLFVKDLAGGKKLITHVTWIEGRP